MSKADKLDEARFFLEQLRGTDAWLPFRYYLSAFLSAARSVLQYACADVENDAVGRAWYDGVMTSSLVLSFFRDKRDYNVHEAPVPLDQEIGVELAESLQVEESVSVTLTPSTGSPVEFRSERPRLVREPSPLVGSKITRRYFFVDWQPQDVAELCEEYMAQLQAVVDEGLGRGLIKP